MQTRMGGGLGLGFTTARGGGGVFNPASLFEGGIGGALFSPLPTTCFTDTERTTTASVGDIVRSITDLSGNGNHASNASSDVTLQRDAFGHYYLQGNTTMLTTGTVFSNPSVWPSIAAVIDSAYNVAAYPISCGIAGQDRHIAIQQGLSSNTRFGIWRRSATGSDLQDGITGRHSWPHVVVANAQDFTVFANGTDLSQTKTYHAPSAGNYSISLMGLNDASPNVAACRFYGGLAINRELTADEITALTAYYEGISPVGNLRRGKLYAMTGQSNMIGRDTSDGTLHAANTAQITGVPTIGGTAYRGFDDAKSPLNHFFNGGSSGPQAGDMGLDVTFSIAHAAGLGGSVTFLPYASGGTSFSGGEWVKGGSCHNAFVDAANRFQTIYSKAPDAILWHQGETDAASGVTQSQYTDFITAMIADFRADIVGADDVPFIVGEIGSFLSAGSYPTATQINAALNALPGTVANAACVETGDLGDLGDDLHFSTASIKIMGERYYDALVSP